jgi:lauroyl/myristoyl acyltransferase
MTSSPDITTKNAKAPVAETPSSRDDLKLIQFLSKIPWKVLWGTTRVCTRTALGRWIWERYFPVAKRRRKFVSQLCDFLDLHSVARRGEILRVYPNTLVETVMCQMARMTVDERSARFRVEGREILETELAAKRPVMLLGSHFGINRVLPLWIALEGIQLVSIEWRNKVRDMEIQVGDNLRVLEMQGAFRARPTLEALRWLRDGGVVHMTGDNLRHDIEQSREFHWQGYRLTVPMGFAQIAIKARATVIPYFCQFDDLGVAQIRFLSPLQIPGDTDHPDPCVSVEREAILAEQFLQVLTREFAKTPGDTLLNLGRQHSTLISSRKRRRKTQRAEGKREQSEPDSN